MGHRKKFVKDNRTKEELSLYQQILESFVVEENEWAVVIKADAAIDAILIRLLQNEIEKCNSAVKKKILKNIYNNESLKRHMDALCLLDCIPDSFVNFVNGIHNLRNKLAHDISYFNFKFDSYNAKMNCDIELIKLGIFNILHRNQEVLSADIIHAVVVMYKYLVENYYGITAFGSAVLPVITGQGTAVVGTPDDRC